MELKRRDNWMSGETVLERERDGHFYASITVDSRDYRVLVDTGASIVALTEQDALDMGLSWDDSEVRVIARGASGDVRGVPVTIPQMQMGGFEAQDVQAAIVPEGLDITLLGQSFLGKIDNVEISGDRMVFGG
jgi:aspartyl protease family protein